MLTTGGTSKPLTSLTLLTELPACRRHSRSHRRASWIGCRKNIRLVIWDLDETFWSGTISEGGHQYRAANHDTVIALANRGIMSSICSKNDFDRVKDVLSRAGIWEYFIFPSISWEPKGPRLKDLIETVQLRPATVLFIDDNHMNLEEAKFFVPVLSVADEFAIPDLLSHPRLKGKPDPQKTG